MGVGDIRDKPLRTVPKVVPPLRAFTHLISYAQDRNYTLYKVSKRYQVKMCKMPLSHSNISPLIPDGGLSDRSLFSLSGFVKLLMNRKHERDTSNGPFFLRDKGGISVSQWKPYAPGAARPLYIGTSEVC